MIEFVLATVFAPALWTAQAFEILGGSSVIAGVGIAYFLRRRPLHLTCLLVDSCPTREEVDAVLAQYDPELRHLLTDPAERHQFQRIRETLALVLLRTAEGLVKLAHSIGVTQRRRSVRPLH